VHLDYWFELQGSNVRVSQPSEGIFVCEHAHMDRPRRSCHTGL